MQRGSQSGFNLVELLLATLLLLIATTALFSQLVNVRRAQKAGQRAVDRHQTTRAGLDRLARELREAGSGSNPDNDATRPDEPIEAALAGAIVLRADLDAGRPASADPELQLAAGGPFETVLTGNDEIVAYVLAKSDGSSEEALSFEADVEGVPRDGLTEAVSIGSISLAQEDPPYTLYRVEVRPDSTGTRRSPVVDGVRRLRFSYFDGEGVALPAAGGLDDAESIRRRAEIRRVRVELAAGAAEAGEGSFRIELDLAPRNLVGPVPAAGG